PGTSIPLRDAGSTLKMSHAMLRKVSIVGAGELGATAAAKLAAAGLVREVVLIGSDAAQAEGKALDLVQSSALLESGCRVRAARDPGEMRDSSCVVVAGPGAGGVEDELPLELPALFETLGAVARDAVVAVAGDD